MLIRKFIVLIYLCLVGIKESFVVYIFSKIWELFIVYSNIYKYIEL